MKPFSTLLLPGRLLALVVMVAHAVAIAAAPSEMWFRHYTTDEGLPSNCVRDIVQDSDGFMWFATDGGVTRFDGLRFITYDLATLSDGLDSDHFASALHERDGVIWAGTDFNLYRYDRLHDRFEAIVITDERNRAVHVPVRCITTDMDGGVWVSLVGAGVYNLAGDGGVIARYDFKELSNYVSDIYVDSKNDIWIVSNQGSGAVYRLDKAADRFREFVLKGDGDEKVNTEALAVTEDSDRNMWLGLWTGGLVCFDSYSGKVLDRLDDDSGDMTYHIHSLGSYSPTTLMAGSDSGLLFYDLVTRQSRHFSHDELNANSLSDRFVYPVVTDREGGLWIGTFYSGVNYLPPELKTFEHYSPSYYRNSVSGRLISRFCESPGGDVYIGSDDAGLCRMSASTGAFTHIPLAMADRTSVNPNIHALCFDGDELWIGTYTNGVGVLDTSTGRLRCYNHDRRNPSSLGSTSCYAILRDSEATMWVGTMSALDRYDRATDSFTHIKDFGATPVDIMEGRDGSLWVATQGAGLFRLDKRSSTWKNYRADGSPGCIAHNHVNHCVSDSKGTVWVATYNGLCRYVAEADTFATVTSPSLPGHEVYSICEDRGTLWLTMTQGLVRYRPDEGYELFTTRDGVCSNRFLVRAAMKTSAGKIFIGSVGGFTAFYPHLVKTNLRAPEVALTGVDINNVTLTAGDNRLERSPGHPGKLLLTNGDRVISLYFAALSYVNPEKNSYRYMLEGFDKEWIDPAGQNKATYTNLPPGNYVFRVKASNNDGVWNDDGASLELKVLPPWYLTTLMKIIYAVLAIVVGIIVFKLLMRHAERLHNIEINRINANNEKAMFQSKLSFFTMIAHEIRTPVSLIIGPLEKIMSKPEQVPAEMRGELNIIERNCKRLLSLVNQLLDFKKVEQSGFNVTFRPVDITTLLESVVTRFKPSVEQKGATLESHYPDIPLVADVDAEAITKLVSNLLNNARKFMKDEIDIAYTVDPVAGTFTITVTDNGVGIKPDDIEKIFTPFYQVTDGQNESRGGTGLGLSIVKNVAEAHNGTVSVDSEPGRMTAFSVTLPVRQATAKAAEPAADTMSPGGGDDAPAVDEETARRKPRMLVVDDNEEMVNFIASNFNGDYDVITALNGLDALESLRRHPEIDMIVSDWMMPKMNGVELCTAVRNDPNFSHIPFVLLTAKTDNYSKIEGLNCGADSYVEKPFSVQYLKARIRNLLDMRSLLRKKFSESPLEPLNAMASNPVDDRLLTDLSKIIEENFSNPDMSVDLLASSLGISRSSLYSKIKTLTNMTPNELIQLTRLKKAARLLAENKYRVSEIGYMVGFNSSSYFSKCFKQQFGVTPVEFVAKGEAAANIR